MRARVRAWSLAVWVRSKLEKPTPSNRTFLRRKVVCSYQLHRKEEASLLGASSPQAERVVVPEFGETQGFRTERGLPMSSLHSGEPTQKASGPLLALQQGSSYQSGSAPRLPGTGKAKEGQEVTCTTEGVRRPVLLPFPSSPDHTAWEGLGRGG